MSGVAFLAPSPPNRNAAACQRCVSALGRRGAAACSRSSPQWAGSGWAVRSPGQALVTHAAVTPSSRQWHTMSAGPSGGGQADEADDGVEVDMELLRKRMEEVQAGGEGGDEDDDASDISIVVEMPAEVRVPIDNDEDEVVVLELVSSVDSDSDDDDDADENQDDGPSVMGQLTPPNSSESKEIATAYRDCASLFIILFNSEGEGEGLYSIQVGGQNVVLAFARVEEAGQYARALRDQRIIDVESIVDIQVAVCAEPTWHSEDLTGSSAVGLSVVSPSVVCVPLVGLGLLRRYLSGLAHSGLASFLSLVRVCSNRCCGFCARRVPTSCVPTSCVPCSRSLLVSLFFIHRSWFRQSWRNSAQMRACGSVLCPPTPCCRPNTCIRPTTRRFRPFRPPHPTHYETAGWQRGRPTSSVRS